MLAPEAVNISARFFTRLFHLADVFSPLASARGAPLCLPFYPELFNPPERRRPYVSFPLLK